MCQQQSPLSITYSPHTNDGHDRAKCPFLWLRVPLTVTRGYWPFGYQTQKKTCFLERYFSSRRTGDRRLGRWRTEEHNGFRLKNESLKIIKEVVLVLLPLRICLPGRDAKFITTSWNPYKVVREIFRLVISKSYTTNKTKTDRTRSHINQFSSV